ncbi:MAG: arsenate reductase [Rhodospirillales bacterium]|nr:arsenate reductase [Rhodospirillales bacterium]
MSKVEIYGIKNCNTMKKAFDWLEGHGVAYDFYDYKKEGAKEELLQKAFAAHGWEKVINRAGMTWRKLPDDVKAKMDETGAMAIALEKPGIIKRPMTVVGNDIHLGFSEKAFQEIFG